MGKDKKSVVRSLIYSLGCFVIAVFLGWWVSGNFVAPITAPSNFKAEVGNQEVLLSWDFLQDSDLKKVQVRVSTRRYPRSVKDGTKVYIGTSDRASVKKVEEGKLYFFSLFAKGVAV